MKKLKILVLTLSILTILSGCGNKNVVKADTQNNTPIETYFTRQQGNLNAILINNINTANKSIYMAIYSITKEDIADSIIKAKNRGLDVKIITDKINSQSKSEETILKKFQKTNIPIKIETHAGLMHMKVCIIDDSILLTGSYNYTENATKENDENLLVIHNADLANQYTTEFNSMWNNVNDYANY
jgi:phosphatidylserine/phosphatidylglycerophosphate/cardiolipin synthase-like enzyme